MKSPVQQMRHTRNKLVLTYKASLLLVSWKNLFGSFVSYTTHRVLMQPENNTEQISATVQQ